MNILRIFADQLFSIRYPEEKLNELDRLLDLWTNPGYLQNYAKRNKVPDIDGFVENILDSAEELEDLLDEIYRGKQPVGVYFQPLQNAEYTRMLSFQKGKIRRNYLRIYALKIDDACFLITGGAIKMSQKMQEHPDTSKELGKLHQARAFLRQQGIFDEGSFFEWMNWSV